MSKHSAKWAAMHRVRLGHVRKLLYYRYGPTLPDDDAGREDLCILLHVKARCYRPRRRAQALLKEIELMAPWLDDPKTVAGKIAANPWHFKSETLGRRLNLDWRTREMLQIWQIGTEDLPPEALEDRRRMRNRRRMRHARRDQGAKPRAEYEAASLSNTKPWEAEGISRRTW
ncbi:MAG: hypothetical protein AB7P20_28060, partial [Rhizobiaceae bacterium]